VALERRLCHWVPRLRRGDVVAARLTCVTPTDRQSFCCHGRCTAGRVWALVVGASDDDDADGASCMVEITRQVPFEWLAAVAGRRDWSAIEWPERARSPALALLNGTKELRLDRDSLDLRLPGRPCSFARRDENDDVEEEPDMGFGTSSCSSASLPLTEIAMSHPRGQAATLGLQMLGGLSGGCLLAEHQGHGGFCAAGYRRPGGPRRPAWPSLGPAQIAGLREMVFWRSERAILGADPSRAAGEGERKVGHLRSGSAAAPPPGSAGGAASLGFAIYGVC